MPRTGGCGQVLFEEGTLLAENEMFSPHTEVAHGGRRLYANLNAPWGTGRRVAHDKGGHESP